MLTKMEIEELRERAYRDQGWDEDGQQRPPSSDNEALQWAFFAGVEAGLLAALGDAEYPSRGY